MYTLLWCIYYDLAGKNISLEGRHLVLTLLASISNRMIVMALQEELRCWLSLQTTSAQTVNTVVVWDVRQDEHHCQLLSLVGL